MTRGSAAFILRAQRKDGTVRLSLHDLKTGQQQTFASWASLRRYVVKQLEHQGLR